MRKIGIVAAVVFVASWIFSLLCMHAAGQAGWKMEEENQNVISESVAYENNQKGSEETAGWNGNSHSVDQGDGEAYSRRIILERYGVRTYLSVEDYLPGVMVCQTGPEMGMEALKCQAVIARTYIYRQMGDREEIQEEELDLDYLGDDTARAGNTLTVHQKEELAKRLEQCRQAAEATAGVVMKYEDRYILPLFHERSAGRTRTGEADYPYLQSVESRWDVEDGGAEIRTADGDETGVSEVSFSFSEFAQRIKNFSDAPSLDPERLSSDIQIVKRDDAGYVLQIKIGPRTYTGDDVQYALDLPSSCFTIDTRTSGTITVTVKGRGHGYGLSQNGAQAMAEEGWSYSDILNYYYKNISLMTE